MSWLFLPGLREFLRDVSRLAVPVQDARRTRFLKGAMMPGPNSKIVQRWFEEVWNERRPEVIEELITPESVCYADDGPIRGADEFKQRQFYPMTAAFPNLRVEVESIIEEGDQVVVRWTATGLHDGEALGFKATRETASFRGLTWIRVQDQKLIEGWQSSNMPEVIRGLATRAAAMP